MKSLTQDQLHAYVDGALEAPERGAVEAWLADHPDDAARAAAYAAQKRGLHARFDSVLDEPLPARFRLGRPAWMGWARAASVLLAGIAIGMGAQAWRSDHGLAASAQTLATRAARAHVVYASEVRHPVEVDASQQEHLVAWLSKRLGRRLQVPVFSSAGYELLGGRLLPGIDSPVAQFMYQGAAGNRLTLYVSARGKDEGQTAFRFAREGRVGVFYWVDGDWGYALSGEIEQHRLASLANAAYRQFNP